MVRPTFISFPNGGLLCMKIFFATQNPRFSVPKSFFCSKIRDSVHQNPFSARKSEILCIKIFFLLENPRFCAPKSFFCSKIRDSVHQNLFSARKSEILCIKIFFLLENLRFCAPKSFFATQNLRFLVSKSFSLLKLRHCRRCKKKASVSSKNNDTLVFSLLFSGLNSEQGGE